MKEERVMNKKLYIQPTIVEVRIETVQMIAGSGAALGSGSAPEFTFQNANTDNSDYGLDAD